LIEKLTSQPESPHANLYGVGRDGKLVLFTKDHIQPKSKGGSNNLWNLQTMCETCNCEKGSMDNEKFVKNDEPVSEQETALLVEPMRSPLVNMFLNILNRGRK
jgi:hypothetical protein